MTIPQFKNWLRKQIKWLKASNSLELNETELEQGYSLIDEAYDYANELDLTKCMGIVSSRRSPSIALRECLAAIPESKTVLTPPEIAEQLGTAPETVIGWIKSGQLKGANLATDHRPRYVVDPVDLAAFLKSRQPQPPAKRKPKAQQSGFRRFSE
jgi:hypothetical protein